MKALIILLLMFSVTSIQAQTNWVAPKEAKAIKSPLDDNELHTARGAQLFDLLCSVCHGETGRGDGVTLEYLNPKPANLTSAKVQAQTKGEIYWKITTGRPPMQSYVNVLSSSEIWQVIEFIKTFKPEE